MSNLESFVRSVQSDSDLRAFQDPVQNELQDIQDSMVEFFRTLEAEGKGRREAVLEGAEMRLRPVLMTAATTALGLLPMVWASGVGSEVQRPLAVVVVFGVVTSTLLTLMVLPVLYDRLGSRP